MAEAEAVTKGSKLPQRTRYTFVQRNLARMLTLPSFIIPYCLIGVWLLGIYYALTDFDMRYGIRNYIGYENFIYLVTRDGAFWKSLGVTLRYASGCILVQLPLGFLVAMLLDRIHGWPQKVARLIVLIPMCIPPLVATLIWKVALGPTQGIVNYLVERIGLPAQDWLGNPKIVLGTLVFLDTWVWTPFVIIILWGGLGSLPRAPYEAAVLDGASSWQIFRKLTLPLMRPFLLIALLFRTCDALNSFDIIYGTTRGGPQMATATLNVLGYDNAMIWWHLGYGMSMVMIVYFLTYFIAKRLTAFWPR
jgi:multiple sugar transport system permease protein